MKKVMAMAVACAVLVGGHAAAQNLIIGVTAEQGYYAPGALNDLSPGILDPTVNPSGQALLQLIFSPVAFLNPANVAGANLLDPLDVAAGARIIGGNQTISLPGGGGTLNASSVYGDGIGFAPPLEPFVAGFLFVRIFEGPLAVLTAGDFYYEFGGVATQSKPPTGSPQVLQTNRGEAFGGFGDLLTLPIVPEPSSVLLLSVGVIGIATARRRRNG